MASSAYTFPVFTYPHGTECSVTGGYVFRGTGSSPFYGYYFFADYCSDRIWTLHNVSGEWVAEEFGQFPGNNFSAFGEDASGQLYIAGLSSGTIYLVVDNSTGINQYDDLAGVKIIQTPFSGKIRIESGLKELDDMQLDLYNIKGSILYTGKTSLPDYEFDPGYLPGGVYFLRIVIDGRSVVRKLFIME